MALNLPEALLTLPANCGVFALWMLFQHHGAEKDIAELAQLCQHDPMDGTFTIALAVALKKMGFTVTFHSAPDPNIDAKEHLIYEQARQIKIPLKRALKYDELQKEIEQGNFVIVYYDTLEGVGNQSLVYSIDQKEICFFDNFIAMPAHIFERQRRADGICQQAIVINDRDFQLLSSRC